MTGDINNHDVLINSASIKGTPVLLCSYDSSVIMLYISLICLT